MRNTPLLVLAAIAVLFSFSCKQSKTAPAGTKKIERASSRDTVAIPEVDRYGIPVDSLQVDDYRVKRNESFYLILDRFDFSPLEIYNITHKAGKIADVASLKPGQKYRVYASKDSSGSTISKLVWQPNPTDYVVFDWHSDSVEIYKASRPVTVRREVASAEINNSLYQAISAESASPLLAYKLADIFAWEIDFFGLRDGDSFRVLYEKKYIDGQFYGIGRVLAAEFIHRGESHTAYQFSEGETDGYFNGKGESVQKALLKTPFKFNHRISSRFSRNRMHPVLNRRIPHNGVDYAAPPGTPILATGSGLVTEAQYRGANGNIVKIKHNSTYRTAYLHLNGFANGIHRGSRVEQGQIIGYVGSTGRVTGPHLHYQVYKNNRPVNPLTLELPSSASVPGDLMAGFQKVRDSLNEQMEMPVEKPQEYITQKNTARK